MKTSAAEL